MGETNQSMDLPELSTCFERGPLFVNTSEMPDLSSLDPSEIALDVNVTGIANIPNQIHHEERHRKHRISIALIGESCKHTG